MCHGDKDELSMLVCLHLHWADFCSASVEKEKFL